MCPEERSILFLASFLLSGRSDLPGTPARGQFAAKASVLEVEIAFGFTVSCSILVWLDCLCLKVGPGGEVALERLQSE